MTIYPAIDIIDGTCVRLQRGDYDKKTVFDHDPARVATGFEKDGAKWLHLVDLDGAKKGISCNLATVRKICDCLSIPIQLGGGIRSMEAIEQAFDAGVQRVILGTVAVNTPDFAVNAIKKYPGRIVIGIDARDGYAAVEGWTDSTKITAAQLAESAQSWGAAAIVYTDIATDGMLLGPNVKAMEQMVNTVSTPVIASGGVSCIQDVHALRSTGVEGVIVGRALYEGRIIPQELFKTE